MVKHIIYVEGGGKGYKNKRTECRRSFRLFFEKANIDKSQLLIEPSGRRLDAFNRFVKHMKNNSEGVPVLLVDSESSVDNINRPWDHLKSNPQDQWDRPLNAADDQAYLMVQVMESWFLLDIETLKSYYGSSFGTNETGKKRTNIERIDKKKVLDILEKATSDKETKKGKYSKGRHSFEILAMIDPKKVIDASPSAKRLIDFLLKNAN